MRAKVIAGSGADPTVPARIWAPRSVISKTMTSPEIRAISNQWPIANSAIRRPRPNPALLTATAAPGPVARQEGLKQPL